MEMKPNQEVEIISDEKSKEILNSKHGNAVDKVEKEKKKAKKDKKEKKDKKSKKEKNIETEVIVEKGVSDGGNVSQGSKSTETPISFDEIEKFRKEHSISVENSEDVDVRPIFSFSKSGINELLLDSVKTFKSPTPIQSQCLPVLVQGKDCIGIAKTGSGKTLAFGLPGLHRVFQSKSSSSDKNAPRMMVISPTRELALQSAEVLSNAGSLVGLKTLCVYGGSLYKQQVKDLCSNPDIIVATPGRLLGLMEEPSVIRSVDLSKVEYIVLDEADRMLDMGFEKDIRKIFGFVGPDRQTVMFSATWPMEIRQLAHEFLKSPVRVVVGSVEATANDSISQFVEVVEDRDKDRRLLSILREYKSKAKSSPYRILVFALYKNEAQRLETLLCNKGYDCDAIHGNKTQGFRMKALDSFIQGTKSVLVATDVAARGLHIPDVELVVNYSFPLTIEDYIHRIGRTGRAGASGIAHTFFCSRDKGLAGELVNVLRESKVEPPEELMKFGTGVKRKQHKLYGAHFKPLSADEPMPKSKYVKFD